MKNQTQEYVGIETNAEKGDNSHCLKIEAVENTPFSIVEENGEFFSVIGNHRITEYFQSKEELERDLNVITWDRVTQVIWAITKKFITDVVV